MAALWAALPIVVALLLLLLRAGPVWSALAALLCAVAVTAWAFPTPIAALAAALWAMLPVMVEVAAILLGGLLLNHMLVAGGAQQRLGLWLAGLCRERPRAIVLMVLGVIPFAESVTGFGVGTIVGIPLLMHLGLSPLRAAVLGLLGLVIVPWGALGPGTLVAARLADIGYQQLGIYSAWLSAPVFIVAGATALIVALGWRDAWRGAGELLLAVAALWLGILLTNWLLGTSIAGVLGTLFTIVVMLVRTRIAEAGPLTWPATLRRDTSPYVVLVVGLLVSQWLASTWGTPIAVWPPVITSPALWLLLTCALTPLLLMTPRHAWQPGLVSAVRQWQPVAAATILFLAFGTLLAASGMSRALAQAGAQLGTWYPAVAPWLGALGGFLASSNTGASAMFATSQAQAAAAIGYPVIAMVALQNVGASLAVMASIPKVMMAAGVAAQTDAVGRRPGNAAVFGRVLAANIVMLLLLSLLALLLG